VSGIGILLELRRSDCLAKVLWSGESSRNATMTRRESLVILGLAALLLEPGFAHGAGIEILPTASHGADGTVGEERAECREQTED
jgi:hypothetical protein